MRLITHLEAGRPRLGAVVHGSVIDLQRATEARLRHQGTARAWAAADALLPGTICEFLAGGQQSIEAAHAAVEFTEALPDDLARRELLRFPYAEIELLCPVPNPGKVICVARNYAEHAKEAGLKISEIPIIFARFASTLVPAGKPIIFPVASSELDWEGELAVVIGTATSGQVKRADAHRHVAGYSIFNDVTVRDFQFRVTQYTSGKNFRGSGPFGPELVLTDEFPDPTAGFVLTTEVNGTVMQQGNTRDMIFDVGTIIEHVTEWVDLEPGDVIAMGTPSGVGFKREPPAFLRPGDTCTVSIEGIGTLSNNVIDERGPHS